MDDLERASHTKRLIITGISLGGGLAVLSYVDIAKAGIFDNIEIVTFGAPRVGNKKWASWFDTQIETSRYFIKNDPFASLPICFTLICNYKQTGVAIRCNKNYESCTELLSGEEEPTLSTQQMIEFFEDAKKDHENAGEHEDNVSGVLDHIFGYKKIKTYSYEGRQRD